MKKNYSSPKSKVLHIEEQELCLTGTNAPNPSAVNQGGTVIDTNQSGGPGNAGGAHSKPYTPWSDEESVFNEYKED